MTDEEYFYSRVKFDQDWSMFKLTWAIIGLYMVFGIKHV